MIVCMNRTYGKNGNDGNKFRYSHRVCGISINCRLLAVNFLLT